MTTTAPNKEAIKANLAADSRDISIIWNEAINLYNQTANDHNEPERVTLTRPTFKDTQAMKNFGFEEMQKFRSWRSKDQKTDKLRTLFMANIDFIDTGSKQLLNAVSASFPPALAISTAMTFVLTGFKSQRADYDVVVNFFEDMNSFLQRVTIIEKRVPAKKAYQNALMDVFTAMLSLCAVARKYVMIGRFKKWVMNSIFGDDNDLKSDRDKLDIYLNRLQDATEYAILENTENMLEQQARLGDVVADMRRELGRNREIQEQIAANQNAATEKISNDVQTMMKDIKKLLSLQQEAKSVKSQNAIKLDEFSGNVVRHFYGYVAKRGFIPDKPEEPFPDMLAVLANLEKSQVEETGSWLFEHPAWLAWADCSRNSPTLLWLEGGPGMGKTHLSLAVYQQLRGIRKPEQEVYTAYFSCRRPDIQRRHTRDLLRNCAIQIADQSPAIRQRLEAMWRSLGLQARVENSGHLSLDSETVDNDIFIYENFSEASGNQLFVVVDGIDQFYKGELDKFFKVVRKVQEQKLRIKFIVTVELTDEITSDTVNMIESQAIRIGREQILPDLMKILWKGINSEDSAYDGLRRLNKHSKQQLAQKIKRNADNLLYVDQTLRFLANTIREGNTENLLDSVPTNLAELYEAILRRSLQSFSADTIRSLKSIVMWLTFSHQPLTLERLGLLAESTSLSSEQILSFVLRFFEVDVISKDTASLLGIEFTELFDDSIEISTENLFSGNSLRLQVKNRATEIFFSSTGPPHALRTNSISDAHRILFLSTVDIILKPKTGNQSLHEYAIEHSLRHWYEIVPEEHTKDEQIQVCRTFVLLISDQRYAEGLARHPRVQFLADIIFDEWEEVWASWSSHALKLNMTIEEIGYWQDVNGALYPLVTALVRCWLKTIDAGRAVRAWRLANDVRKTVRKTVRGEASLRSYGERDAVRLAGILGDQLDSQAHLAIGSVLALSDFYTPSAAIQEVRRALDNSRDAALRTRCYILLSSICIEAARWNDDSHEGGRLEDAVEYCKLILEGEGGTLLLPKTLEKSSSLQEMRAASDSKMRESLIAGNTESAENLALRASTRAEVLRIQGLVMKGLGKNIEAAESFCAARQLSTGIGPVQQLFDELLCLKENHVMMVDRLLSFSPIDRLRFVTGNSYVGEPGHTISIPPERMILPASVKSQKSNEVVKIYREIIKALDAEQAGAPVRVDLARILWRLRYNIKSQPYEGPTTTGEVVDEEHAFTGQGTIEDLEIKPNDETLEAGASDSRRFPKRNDQSLTASVFLQVKEAKFLLNQVLDSVSGERTYKLTDRDPLSVAISALLLMTDILLEEFRSSKKVEDKVQILLQAKELPRRKFIASQPLITDDTWSQYNTAVAHMLRKIGPMSEYEQVMTNIFDKAIAGLKDDTRYNDRVYLTSMSRIFMLEPSLHKFGEMLTAVEWDEGIYPCDGICIPVTVYDGNDSIEPCYQCLVCTNTKLCQRCYEIRVQWNRDPTIRSITDLDFCCPNGQYMRIPIGSWNEGGGYVYSNSSHGGDERIPTEPKQLTEYLKKVWKDAWEDIASAF